MAHRIFIIGNAAVAGDFSQAIDSAHLIVRFNLCQNLGKGTGSRTTELWLTNTGKAGFQFTNSSTVSKLLYSTIPERVVLARGRATQRCLSVVDNEEAPYLQNFGAAILPLIEQFGTPCDYAKSNTGKDLMDRLRQYGKPAIEPRMPSTGVLAVHHFTTCPTYAKSTISLVGFGFEGWKYHPWDLERAYVEDLASEGRLTLFDSHEQAPRK